LALSIPRTIRRAARRMIILGRIRAAFGPWLFRIRPAWCC